MRVLPVELDGETIEALDVERELLGFESRSAYVRWLLDHRGSIEPDVERASVLAVYRERVARLEDRLRRVEGERGTEDESECDTDSRRGSGGDDRPRTDVDGWTGADDDPTVEVRGSPRTTVVKGPVTPAAGDDESTDDDASVDREPDRNRTRQTDHDVVTSMYLTPERVARVSEDAVGEDASVLGSVEAQRIDELTRRAVSKTRPLDRNVERSSSSGSDVRPGDDVTDLSALSVPGRSDDLVERRQAVAGRAIAFLREEGQARKSDFVDALYEEFPAEYETSDGWWRCIKGALEQVDGVDGGDGTRVWRFTR